MKKLLGVLFVLLSICGAVQADADNGLIDRKSQHGVKETLDRLESALRDKGFTIVVRWSHDAGAKKAGMELRPTELLIFGNPKVGTHFFTSQQTAGIDLPMKMLAWRDAQGQVWLTYNDPAWIARRHGITDREQIVAKMSKALANFSRLATE